MTQASLPEISGILLMNKPAGFTSFDVVAKLRGILHIKKIGHGGTLDPMATGVLPIFVGGATRAAEAAAAQEKEYIAGFALGFATDTQDTTGTVTAKTENRVTEYQVVTALDGFLGAQKQLPPMYSAVQVEGKRLYDLARKGIEVERAARDITIREIELLSFDEKTQTGSFRALCSKGTYVRTIVHDLGERLGTLGALNSLCRTRSGTFALCDTVGFAEIEQARDEGTLSALFRPTESLFTDLQRVEVDEENAVRVANGAVVFPRYAKGLPMQEGALSRVYCGDKFLMVGQTKELDKGGLALFVYKKF